jgi:hypothetical protein
VPGGGQAGLAPAHDDDVERFDRGGHGVTPSVVSVETVLPTGRPPVWAVAGRG